MGERNERGKEEGAAVRLRPVRAADLCQERRILLSLLLACKEGFALANH